MMHTSDFSESTGRFGRSVLGKRQTSGLTAGIFMGLVFIFSCGLAAGEIDAAAPSIDFFPASVDGIFAFIISMGLLVSLYAAVHAVGSWRMRGRDIPTSIVAFSGIVISSALFAIHILDQFELATGLLSMEGSHMWLDGRPTYLLPLSLIGPTLAMVSLVIMQGGNSIDKMMGVVLSCLPLGVFSLPVLMGYTSTELLQWMPTLFFAGGFALAIAGLKPHTSLSRLKITDMDRYLSKVLTVMLVITGILAWMLLDTGEQLSKSDDAVWLLPLFVNSVMSVLMIAAVWNLKSDNSRAVAAMSLSGLALGWSLSQLVLFMLSVPDAFTFEREIVLLPASIAGVSLLMISVTIITQGTSIDKIVGLIAGAIPLAVSALAAAALTISIPFLSKIVAGENGTTFNDALWTESTAFVVYIVFALSVFLSGFKIDTFIETQWLVVREKLKLALSRFKQVTLDVLKNPMGLIGTVILIFFCFIAAFGPYIAPYEVDATRSGLFEPYLPSSSEHWMGTDVFGHDIFSSLLYGARTSIIVGMFAAIIASFVGAAVGLYSGYAGGWKDEALMRINDVMLSIPWLVLMILIAGLIGTISLTAIILIIGLTGWSATARLVRAQVLSLRERQYIERARAIGSSDFHIIRTHILPNSFPLVFANTILTVAISILSEATLSFLHMRPYGSVTWGTMLSYAYESSAFQMGLHYWIIMPGLCIVFLVLGFTLLGYAMDEVLNPRLRRR